MAIARFWPAIAGCAYAVIMLGGWYWIHTAPPRPAPPTTASEPQARADPAPPLDTALARRLETIEHEATSAKHAAETARQAAAADAGEIAALRSGIRDLDHSLRCPAADAPLTPQEVRTVQAALLGQGLSKEADCDGIAGPKFKSSVSAYQTRINALATGALSREQFGRLLRLGPLPSCACPARGACPGSAPAAVRPQPPDCFTPP